MIRFILHLMLVEMIVYEIAIWFISISNWNDDGRDILCYSIIIQAIGIIKYKLAKSSR